MKVVTYFFSIKFTYPLFVVGYEQSTKVDLLVRSVQASVYAMCMMLNGVYGEWMVSD